MKKEKIQKELREKLGMLGLDFLLEDENEPIEFNKKKNQVFALELPVYRKFLEIEEKMELATNAKKIERFYQLEMYVEYGKKTSSASAYLEFHPAELHTGTDNIEYPIIDESWQISLRYLGNKFADPDTYIENESKQIIKLFKKFGYKKQAKEIYQKTGLSSSDKLRELSVLLEEIAPSIRQLEKNIQADLEEKIDRIFAQAKRKKQKKLKCEEENHC